MTPNPETSPENKTVFRWVPLEENDCLVWYWGGSELGICFLSRYSTILLFFFKSHLHSHCQRYLQPKPFRYVRCTWSCLCAFPATSSVVSSQSAFQPLHFVAVVWSPHLCKNPCTVILMDFLKKMELNVFVDSTNHKSTLLFFLWSWVSWVISWRVSSMFSVCQWRKYL